VGTYYFDTSAVVKLYVAEAGSAWIENIVNQRSGNDFEHAIAFVKIGIVEAAAALTRRQRMGDITLAERDQLYASFMQDVERRYLTMAVSDDLLLLAAELTQQYLLRGYDAVHVAGAISLNQQLAAARLPALTFVSADEMLCDVALARRLKAENPNEHGEESEDG
jgi:predicted nucleic acid-binding protein